MEDDTDSDTIMLVEEDTVLEVLSEVEENTRTGNHSEFIFIPIASVISLTNNIMNIISPN